MQTATCPFPLEPGTSFKSLAIIGNGGRFVLIIQMTELCGAKVGVAAELFCCQYKRDYCHRHLKKKGQKTLTNETANYDSYQMTSPIIASEGNAWCVLCQEHIQLSSLPCVALPDSFCIGQGLVLRNPFEIFISPLHAVLLISFAITVLNDILLGEWAPEAACFLLHFTNK